MAEDTTPTHTAINGPAVNGPVVNGPATGGAAVNHPAANGPAANNPAVGDPAAGGLAINGPAINGSAVNGEDVLARICVTTRAEVTARKAATSLDALRQTIAAQADKPRGFGRAIKHATGAGHYALIAEIKKASPSGGLIRADFDAATLAAAYAAGGATCLSVLTDARFFQGSNADLTAARGACALPMLRKDFILDPWQVYESRAIGADCILLIMAALTDAEARALEETARELDMDVLAEVHDRRELDRALGLQTQLIGINNRN
ncbi:MAG: indole-3-glycerol phosphate synthase TrpC, partial [Acetobacteraceae bacterium]